MSTTLFTGLNSSTLLVRVTLLRVTSLRVTSLRYNYSALPNISDTATVIMDNIIYKLVSNDRELRDALEVRRQVFVQEQGISENLEYDSYDEEALHMVVKDGEDVIGTARVRFPAAGQAKIERMAILKPFRRKGIGSGIISYLNAALRNRQIEEVVLHAQYAVTAFYESCGFEETGSPFWDANIKHIEMRMRL